MTVDLLSPAQLAFVQALKAVITDVSVQHTMKQGAQPPFVLVGNIESDPVDDDGQLELLSVEIQSVYRGSDRGELLALMHRVRSACDGVALPEQDGVAFGLPRFAGAAASSTPADGVTFAGITNFEVHAQPA